MNKHGALKNEDIATFVDLLVKEKNFVEVEPEVLEQIKEDLASRLENIINGVIVASLPKDKLPEFDALLDKADSQKLQDFCAANIPNLQEVVTQELSNFRKAYLGIE